jgi:hypothetical protein
MALAPYSVTSLPEPSGVPRRSSSLPPPVSPRHLFGLGRYSAYEANAVVGPQRGYSGLPPSLSCPSPGDCCSDQEAARWLAS